MPPTAGAVRRHVIRAWSTWYFLVPIVTVGLFAFVPFVHAAVRLRRRRVRWLAALYGAFTALLFVSVAVAPPVTLGAIAVTVAACVQLVPLRRAVYGVEPAAPADIDPAVAAVMRARERRRKARELVEQDPLLARELHIGRPDLPGDYDDGGLVDLNAAPAEAIARACEIGVDQAHQIVAVRDGAGGLNGVSDLYLHLDLPPGAWDRIRDRAIVLPK
ncbi:hypothetical protein [Gandjariella thermophila]|uniref:Uncharacterized protein n=1 Tax=Gandjariella thermophila TaxID=1931992 RepID=A0A4D4JE83_9PSEU|nr:hypothetical protein [Gandjariella thermophila]GDY33350.1 hypothetical protein GTS_49830 [Gandjariella thermophila]